MTILKIMTLKTVVVNKKKIKIYMDFQVTYQKPRILPDKKLRTEFSAILFILHHTPNQLLKVPKDKQQSFVIRSYTWML